MCNTSLTSLREGFSHEHTHTVENLMVPRKNCRVSPEISFHFQLSLWLFFRKPRICGEKLKKPHVHFVCKGSPPRMRGKVFCLQKAPCRGRITPAHAGKSLIPASLAACSGDHPRTCGEKTWKPSTSLPTPGSPPHMRGKAICCFICSTLSGITPAHAGKRNRDCSKFGG